MRMFLFAARQNKLVFESKVPVKMFQSKIVERFKAQWLLYVPPGLTFANSAFCPHSVFMCFVWISEQTAIIYL
jgi:hypothetical protein